MSAPRVFWNSISGVVLFAVQIVIAFVMTPFLVKALGDRDYGLWELLLGLVGYLGILDLGITPALMRFVAHAEGRDDQRDLQRVFSSSLVMMFGIGLLGALTMAVAGIWGDQILAVDGENSPNSWLLFLLFGLSFLTSFVMGTFSSFMMGLQRHSFINGARVVAAIIQSVAMWYALTSHDLGEYRLAAMCGILIGLGSLEAIVFGYWVLRVDRRVTLNVSSFSWVTVRELTTFGIKNTLIMGALMLLSRGILFVIAHVVSVAAVVFYLIPGRVVQYASGLIGAVGFPITPFFASLAGKGGPEAQREYWFPVSRVLMTIGIGVQIAVLWLGPAFISLWMGPEYAVNGSGVLIALSIGALCATLVPNGNRILVSLGMHGRLAFYAAALSIGAILLSIPLTHRFSVTGAAASAAAFSAAIAAVELTLACRVLGIRIIDHVRLCVVRFVVPAALCSLAFWLASRWLPADSYLTLLLHGVFAGTIWLAACLAFGFTSEDRAFLFTMLKRKRVGETGVQTP